MKKVLIITQSYNVGGLETYIKTTSEFFNSEDMKIYMATSLNSKIEELAPILSETLFIDSWELNKDGINSTVKLLQQFIEKNQIDYVLIHPHESLIMGGMASVLSNVPYAVFVHGPINISYKYGYNYLFFLKNYLFKNADKVFCVSQELQDLLLQNFDVQAELAVNPINTNTFKYTIESNGDADYLFVGRLDIDKLESAKNTIQFVDYLKKNYGDNRNLKVVGEGNAKQELEKWIVETIQNHQWIIFSGYSATVEKEMAQSSVVFGMGRVVLEACSLNRPVVLAGYDGLKGLVSNDNFKFYSYSNFSGRYLNKVTFEKLYNSLKLHRENSNTLTKDIGEDYSVEKVGRSIVESIQDSSKIEYRSELVDNIKVLLNVENFTDGNTTALLKQLSNEDNLYFAEVETHLVNLHAEIVDIEQKNELMKAANVSLQKNLEEISDAKQSVSEQLVLLENSYKNKQQDYDNLYAAYYKLSDELNRIYSSKIWKSAKRYYNFRNRRSYINRSLNFIRKHGKKEFLRAIKGKFTNKVYKKYNKPLHERQLKGILGEHKNKKIIIFPPLVDWNIPLYQRPQHIALNLAEKGYLYFFCTANMQYDNIDGFEKLSDSCYLTNRFDLLQTEIDSKILHLYSTDMNPHKELIDSTIANGDKILYEYIDEIHEDLSGPIPLEVMQKHERLLMDEENCIAVGSADKLYDDIAKFRSKNMALVTNGVEYDHFNITKDKFTVPDEIKHIVEKGKPIIGYFGAFATWFDYELVVKLATERPQYEILLIGWNYDNSIQQHGLEKYDNLTVIGPIQYKDLPRYSIHFSVSTIPFVLNDITESTSPIKLFEYMALGHPIVTTDMPECRKYESVLIGKEHREFVDKIDEALTLANDENYNQLLEKEAHENTWSAKATAISSKL